MKFFCVCIVRMSSGEDSDKDWVRCAAWLIRCQALPREHRAAQPTASQNDLAHILRDGVIICILLNRLHPRAIDPRDFSQRPQMSQVVIFFSLFTE
jgi:guanine nucleotide exchange factor VAV